MWLTWCVCVCLCVMTSWENIAYNTVYVRQFWQHVPGTCIELLIRCFLLLSIRHSLGITVIGQFITFCALEDDIICYSFMYVITNVCNVIELLTLFAGNNWNWLSVKDHVLGGSNCTLLWIWLTFSFQVLKVQEHVNIFTSLWLSQLSCSSGSVIIVF